MKSEMTSRERVLAAMRREPVDYVPCVPGFNPLTRVQRQGHTWNFPWSESASQEDRVRYQVDVLGTDPVVSVGHALIGSEPGVTARTWLEGTVLHKEWDTPSGPLHAAVACSDLWPHGMEIPFFSDFNIGHFVTPWIENEEDLARFRHVYGLRLGADSLARTREGLAAARAFADELNLVVQGGAGTGLTGAMQLWGATELCIATLEDAELVDAFLEYEHGVTMAVLEVFGEGGVDSVRRNGFYETADFYGPEMLGRFLGDRLRKETAATRDAGMASSYTVHTGVAPILDHLGSLGFDQLFGIDTAFHGIDLAHLRDELAPNTSFAIGPSSTFHIWQGPEATRQAVREVFDVFGHQGLALSQCVSSHSIMPWESTEAMVDEWKKLRCP